MRTNNAQTNQMAVAKKRGKYLLTRRTKSEILAPCFEVGYVPNVVPLAGEGLRSSAHRIISHRITLSRLP
jgi:hypothetical protein